MNTNSRRSCLLGAIPFCPPSIRSFRRPNGLIFCLVLVFGLLIFAVGTLAQNTVTGAFQGDISSNRTGDPIAGVVVRITSVQTGVVYNLTTDSKGRFYQGLLAPGFYDISVTVTGFAPRLLRREIKVSFTGEVVPVPVSMEPTNPAAAPTQAVLETSDDIRIEINTKDARRDGSTKKDQITQIPLGGTAVTRSFDEIALLTPGVVPPPQPIGDVAGPGVGPGVGSAGQFSVNGLRSRANNFTVDGSDNNDEDIGVRRQGFVALTPQPIESIQEFQVITLLAPAQFGRNIGAQVNAVSKQGANKRNGSVYGFFNSNHLNARNYFDTANGSAVSPLTSATGQPVLLDGQSMTVRNQSGGKDPFTALQGGAVLGGTIVKNKLFYFVSGEYQRINATKEKNFVVPTIEERGSFGTGASGIYRNPITGANENAVPTLLDSSTIFSLFPFSNNPKGIYGTNTFTQMLPSSGKGAILSGRLDNNFKLWERQQTFTARYNFTDDKQNIPAVGEAIFAAVLSKIQTHNLSLFLNSQLNPLDSSRQLSNQVRFSIGRSGLEFEEVRDTQFMSPTSHTGIPFLLNAPLRLNNTLPQAPGVPNTGPVILNSSFFYVLPPSRFLRTVEEGLSPNLGFSSSGALGQVIVNGFSSLGVDVNNFPQTRVNKTYQIADELSWRLTDHTFVFGADIRLTGLNSDLPRQSRPLVVFNGGPRLICLTVCGGGLPFGTYRFPTKDDPNPIVRSIDLAALGGASSSLLNYNFGRPDAKADLRYGQYDFYAQDAWRVRDNLSISYGLRYEYNSPVHEVTGWIEKTFSDPSVSNVPDLGFFLDGRKTLYDPDHNNFAPRIGIAYSPKLFGNRLSVLRAGYGVFYDQILGAVVNQSRNVYPTFLTGDDPNCFECVDLNGRPFSYQNPVGISDPSYNPLECFSLVCPIAVLPGTLNIVNPAYASSALFSFGLGSINVTLPARHLVMPAAHHFSFFYEQQLNRNLTLSIGYVGTKGRNLLRFATPNLGTNSTKALLRTVGSRGFGEPFLPGCSTGTRCDTGRPHQDIGTVYLFETTASSIYNSLQTQLRGRLSKSFSLQLAYTFSKATDDVSDVFDVAGAYALAQNSLDLKAESGPANFDVRHRWTYQFIYDVPRGSNSFLRAVTSNLQVSSTGKFHSGQPFTVNSTVDINLDGNITDRLDSLHGIEVTGKRDQPLRLTTNNYLSLLAPFGQNGSIGRNSFRAGSVLDLDLSVIKRFPIGDGHFDFRTDIFNFINRCNFGVPIRLLEAPAFGKATGTTTPGRRVQFALKYEF